MSSTARRLFFGFSLLVAAFAVASWSALRAIGEIHGALQGVARREENVRTALALSSAVRDQYAHIAHTLLLGNLSHRGFYATAQQRVRELLEELERKPHPPEAAAHFSRIRQSTSTVDELFEQKVVPALARGDRDAAAGVHGDILMQVSQIQHAAEELAHLHEEDIQAFKAHASATQQGAFSWNLALLGGAIAFAALVGAWIGRSIHRPVKLLEEGARRLEAGELGTQIPLESKDEFGRLARQFNQMSVALKEQQERLVQQEKLASVGRLAAGVAHEINNPVGVILGYVKLMKGRADGQLGDDLRIVEEEALRCQEIVQGLLDLARPPKLSLAAVQLREVLDEVAERIAEDARVPRARIAIEGDARAEADANKVRQIVENLVRNAAEAAGETGHVTVRIEQGDGGAARVRVRDDGPGLAPDIAHRLFEPFVTTRPRGTGLGLAVSRTLAEAQRGALAGASLPEGGAEFVLTLPGGPP